MGILYIIFAATLFIYLWSRRKFYILAWKVKGPLGLPFLGNVQLLNPKSSLKYLAYLGKTYKTPCTGWLGPICFLYVNDPENMERILKAPECVNKSVLYDSITRVIGEGLLSSGNPKWSSHRKLLNPVFNNKNLMSFFPVFNSETNILCMKLKSFANTRNSFDIKDFMERCTLGIACQTIMGTKGNIQLDENNQILKSANFLTKCAAKEFFSIFYRFEWFTKFFDFNYYEEKRKVFADINYYNNLLVFGKLYQHEVNPKIVETEKNKNFIKSECVFIDHVTNLFQQKIFLMDDVMSESYHIAVAAYGTTSKALYNIITLLAIHPEWQEKLYEEVKQVLPDKNSDVLFEHIEDAPLVEMIINETLRLLPVVPLQARQNHVDFQLNDDIFIPKDTSIFLDIHSLHRNPKYWGSDALEFNPDHFLSDAIRDRHPYAFLPFSKGFRNCLGWRYAYFLLKIFVIKIFRNYRFTTKTTMEEIEIYFNIVSELKVEPVFEVYTRAN